MIIQNGIFIDYIELFNEYFALLTSFDLFW